MNDKKTVIMDKYINKNKTYNNFEIKITEKYNI